jgi:hypothetical protein
MSIRYKVNEGARSSIFQRSMRQIGQTTDDPAPGHAIAARSDHHILCKTNGQCRSQSYATNNLAPAFRKKPALGRPAPIQLDTMRLDVRIMAPLQERADPGTFVCPAHAIGRTTIDAKRFRRGGHGGVMLGGHAA